MFYYIIFFVSKLHQYLFPLVTVNLNYSSIIFIMLVNRVYGEQYNINPRQFKEPNQICNAVFLSIDMCLVPFTTKVLLDRYKHIA